MKKLFPALLNNEMKKYLTTVLIALFIFAGCGNNSVSAQQPPNADGSKILVVYFSATGNTRTVAGHVANTLNATLHEIRPQILYTSADLDWRDSSSRSNMENSNASARPAISGTVENIGSYDIIFIGYPIWFGQAPRIINTFLESYNFSGKTIIPFSTSGSSDMGSSATNLHRFTTNANWFSGNRFPGNATRNAVVQWVNSLNLR